MFMKYVLAAAIVVTSTIAALTQPVTRYQIRVLNDTSSPIVAIYARNLQTDQLYGNLLRSSVPVDGVTTVTLTDGTGSCFWRLQADFANGTESRKNINVCNTTSWRVYD